MHFISKCHSERNTTDSVRTEHQKRLKCIGYPRMLAKIKHPHPIYFATSDLRHRISQLTIYFLRRQCIKPFLSNAA